MPHPPLSGHAIVYSKSAAATASASGRTPTYCIDAAGRRRAYTEILPKRYCPHTLDRRLPDARIIGFVTLDMRFEPDDAPVMSPQCSVKL